RSAIAAGAADPVRRPCDLAAGVALARGSGSADRLLARHAGGGAAGAGAAARPAAPARAGTAGGEPDRRASGQPVGVVARAGAAAGDDAVHAAAGGLAGPPGTVERRREAGRGLADRRQAPVG